MYQIGDYVVKANAGVCRVADIQEMSLTDTSESKLYYLLLPLENANRKIYIPVNPTGNNKVRKVMSADEAWQMILAIPKIESVVIQNEKQREQQYKQAIQSCNPKLLVGLIKNVYQKRMKRMAEGKKNTIVDERYFKLAEDNLYEELAFALGKNKEDISQIITDAIAV